MPQKSPSDAGKCLSSPPGEMTQASAANHANAEQMSDASATDLLFGGELYADLLGFAGPEAIAYFRDDREWRRAMDELPDGNKKKLGLPVLRVPRPSVEDRRLLRELLTEPVHGTAESGAAGEEGDAGAATRVGWKFNELGLRVLARSPLTSNAVIGKMIASGNCSDDIYYLIAARESTSSKILAGLLNLENPVVFPCIAEHCNATSSILSDLLVQLSKSNLSEDIISGIEEEVGRHKETSEMDLVRLSIGKDDMVRGTVAENSSTPEWVLGQLSTDDDDSVRQSLARNVSTPLSLLQKLASDVSFYVRRTVAHNSKVTFGSDIFKILANDIDERVVEELGRCHTKNVDCIFSIRNKLHRYCLAMYSKDSETLKRLISLDGGRYQEEIAYNPNAPSKILEYLAQSEDSDVRLGVAENKSVPGRVLEMLSEDDEECVRKAVAENSSTLVHTLKKLSSDHCASVRESVAANESTTFEILESMLPRAVEEKMCSDPDHFPLFYFLLINKNFPSLRTEEIISELLIKNNEFAGNLLARVKPYQCSRKLHTVWGLIQEIPPKILTELVLAMSQSRKAWARRNAAGFDVLPVRDVVRIVRKDMVDECDHWKLCTNPLVQIAADNLSQLLSDDIAGHDLRHTAEESWW